MRERDRERERKTERKCVSKGQTLKVKKRVFCQLMSIIELDWRVVYWENVMKNLMIRENRKTNNFLT